MATPHDALVKGFLGDPANAQIHLRTFLPAEVVEHLDLSQLTQRSGSFVDDELRERHADLLFEVPLRDGEGAAFVYVLLEHQSSSDALMPLRLLRYMMRIWDRLVASDKSRRSLPPIVPMVLHHSPSGTWRAPVDFRELLDGPDAVLQMLEPYVPQFRFILTDVTAEDDARFRDTAQLEVLYLLLKHIWDGDLLARLPTWDALRRQVADPSVSGLRSRSLVIEYLLSARDFAIEALSAATRTMHPDMPELIETTADRLRKEGRLKGREEGRLEGQAEGREAGRLEGQAKAVVTALEARGMSLTDELRERIFACRDEAELDRLMKRAIVVGAVTELFADDGDAADDR